MLRFLSDPQSRKLHFLLYKVFSKKIPSFHIVILFKNHKKMPAAYKKTQKNAIFFRKIKKNTIFFLKKPKKPKKPRFFNKKR